MNDGNPEYPKSPVEIPRNVLRALLQKRADTDDIKRVIDGRLPLEQVAKKYGVTGWEEVSRLVAEVQGLREADSIKRGAGGRFAAGSGKAAAAAKAAKHGAVGGAAKPPAKPVAKAATPTTSGGSATRGTSAGPSTLRLRKAFQDRLAREKANAPAPALTATRGKGIRLGGPPMAPKMRPRTIKTTSGRPLDDQGRVMDSAGEPVLGPHSVPLSSRGGTSIIAPRRRQDTFDDTTSIEVDIMSDQTRPPGWTPKKFAQMNDHEKRELGDHVEDVVRRQLERRKRGDPKDPKSCANTANAIRKTLGTDRTKFPTTLVKVKKLCKARANDPKYGDDPYDMDTGRNFARWIGKVVEAGTAVRSGPLTEDKVSHRGARGRFVAGVGVSAARAKREKQAARAAGLAPPLAPRAPRAPTAGPAVHPPAPPGARPLGAMPRGGGQEWDSPLAHVEPRPVDAQGRLIQPNHISDTLKVRLEDGTELVVKEDSYTDQWRFGAHGMHGALGTGMCGHMRVSNPQSPNIANANIDEALGLHVVPRTARLKGTDLVGMEMIPDAKTARKVGMGGMKLERAFDDPRSGAIEAGILDVITDQNDRHGNNFMVTEIPMGPNGNHARLHAVDNDLSGEWATAVGGHFGALGSGQKTFAAGLSEAYRRGGTTKKAIEDAIDKLPDISEQSWKKMVSDGSTTGENFARQSYKRYRELKRTRTPPRLRQW